MLLESHETRSLDTSLSASDSSSSSISISSAALTASANCITLIPDDEDDYVDAVVGGVSSSLSNISTVLVSEHCVLFAFCASPGLLDSGSGLGSDLGWLRLELPEISVWCTQRSSALS